MNKLERKSKQVYLLIILLGIFAPLNYQQEAHASVAFENAFSVQAGDFAPGKLEEHFLKHGYQFGYSTKEQYLQGAQALLDAAPGEDILEKTRPNGDIEHFRLSTGEFAVMSRKGRIRTYFRTTYHYWLRRE